MLQRLLFVRGSNMGWKYYFGGAKFIRILVCLNFESFQMTFWFCLFDFKVIFGCALRIFLETELMSETFLTFETF